MTSKKNSSRNKIIVAIVAVVVAALAVALFVGGSDDSSSNGSNGSTATNEVPIDGLPNGEGVSNQPVEVVGNALEPFVSPNEDPAVGQPAPTLNGKSFDGTPVSITPGDGREYMVVFLAHWCPHCNAEIPQLIKWKEAGSVPDGLQVIGISTSVASDRPNYPPSEWVLAAGWPWPIIADSEAMDAVKAFGVTGFPFFAVIDGEGTVKVRVSGEVKPDVLDQLLESALG